jgi:hypothetical protein
MIFCIENIERQAEILRNCIKIAKASDTPDTVKIAIWQVVETARMLDEIKAELSEVRWAGEQQRRRALLDYVK